jgi:hypothetical protein
MTEMENPQFWREIDQHLNRAAELAVRGEEAGRRKRELIARLEQEVRTQEAARRFGISWNSLGLGVASSTAATAPVLAATAGPRERGYPRRRRRWMWR